MLATYPNRRQIFQSNTLPYTQTLSIPQQQQNWYSSPRAAQPPLAPQQFIPTTNSPYSFGTDQPLYDFHSPQYSQTPSQTLMHPESPRPRWQPNGQLTPKSSTRAHHRESSLSSLGSAGPASPFTTTSSHPQVAGEVYNDYHDYTNLNSSAKPLTPHTPAGEQLYQNFNYNSSYPIFTMGNEAHRASGDADLMPAPDFSRSARPSIASAGSHDSPSTPPSYEEDRVRKNCESSFDPWLNEYLQLCDDQAYKGTIPKFERTLTDCYVDGLYAPDLEMTSAPSTSTSAAAGMVSPQNDVFNKIQQIANSSHLNASKRQSPHTLPTRERSPFRTGARLDPTLGSERHLRDQQKAEDDERALQHHLGRTAQEHSTPHTVSPQEVDLVFHENEQDSKVPLFPSQPNQIQNTGFRQHPVLAQEISESDDNLSHQSYGSMATTRRESSSAYSRSSQTTQQQTPYSFVPPTVTSNVQRQMPQQYPFVSQARRQPSNLSTNTEEFPATLTSMESSSSEYAPDASEMKKPLSTSADTGTYTCTYHGCTQRFNTPALLQRHKREGHRNPAVMGTGDEGGMTSAAQRNSQAGPHRCDRINPSTGKACNTIFSRPYDLTRHEDTIHNAGKVKVQCPICREDKTFSRNDALTRHMRVVHPDHADNFSSSRRRRGGGTHS